MAGGLISHFRCSSPSTLKAFLQAEAGLSPGRADFLIGFGAVYVNGRRTRSDVELLSEEIVRLHFQPKRYAVPSTLQILHEDDSTLIIDKPPGLPTHPTLDNYHENAWRLIQLQTDRLLYVTHRLDIATQGLLLFAKTPKAQAALNREFEMRRVKKLYRATTTEPPPPGRFEHFIHTDGPIPKTVQSAPFEGGQTAILTVLSIRQVGDLHVSEIELETGRTHQIRAQLAHLKCPIINDDLYGGTPTATRTLGLECFHLSFRHRSEPITVSRPLCSER